MKIARHTLKNILISKAFKFEKFTKDPLKVQQEVLREFITRNRNTLYGKEYSFKMINTIDDYQKRVPINDYQALWPYVKRLTEGEENILTRDKTILFGTTSGTTGAPKFIPVTQYSRQKKADVMNLWVYYIMKDYPDIFKGKILAIVSPEIENNTTCGLPYGAETGHAYKNMPYLIRCFYAIPYPVFEIKDYAAKYYCILRLSIEQNISNIATMNPSTVVLLCRKIEEFKDAIIEDIENGTLKKDLHLRDDIRRVIEKRLKPNPSKASFLKKLLKETGTLKPKDFWPELKLIECWKGGSVGMYLKEFPKYFGKTRVRDFGYLSSEARCSIPTEDDKCCGILAINANFYEFIPKEEKADKLKRPVLCNELEKGKEYFVILTTPGGLYRYDIDDVVRVTGFYNKTPRIEFVQKGLNVISVTGEKLYESQVVEAVKNAVEKSGVTTEFFTACIQWGQLPRYVFLVEFKDAPPNERKRDFLRFIDDEIKVLNVEYEAKRVSQRLDKPILKVVKKGDFQRYRVKRVESGSHDGQFKMPQLTRDLQFQKHFEVEEEICL